MRARIFRPWPSTPLSVNDLVFIIERFNPNEIKVAFVSFLLPNCYIKCIKFKTVDFFSFTFEGRLGEKLGLFYFFLTHQGYSTKTVREKRDGKRERERERKEKRNRMKRESE